VQGIAASQGIAYGQIFRLPAERVEVPSYQVDPEKRIAEVARFDRALLVTRQQISKIKTRGGEEHRRGGGAIFDAHLMVLEDEALIGETIREFESTGRNIETCFNKVSSRYVQAFSPRLTTNTCASAPADIATSPSACCRILLGPGRDLAEPARGAADRRGDRHLALRVGSLDRSAALALVTDSGSKTSHAVIVARSMKIPAVVGVRDLTTRLQNGDWAIVDGYDGVS
jgi:phosphotransferase system enzyme I (PtsI)